MKRTLPGGYRGAAAHADSSAKCVHCHARPVEGYANGPSCLRCADAIFGVKN